MMVVVFINILVMIAAMNGEILTMRNVPNVALMTAKMMEQVNCSFTAKNVVMFGEIMTRTRRMKNI